MSNYDALVDQLRANLARLPSEDRLEGLRRELALLQVPVLAVDDSGHYVAFSPSAAEVSGYAGDELLGMSVIELTPIPSAEDGRELWESFMRVGRQRGTYELRHKQGAAIAVRYWAYANVYPGVHLSFLEDAESSGKASQNVA